MSADVASLVLAQQEQLPARASTAAKVLALADDPDADAREMAMAIAGDPVFAAKVLQVANSSYYGLSGRVGTLPFAVSVVGFRTVRSLAVVLAAGLEGQDRCPAGFWSSTALAATAAESVAGLLGADPGDAFCLGLLHTLGSALLHQHRSGVRCCLPEDEATEELLDKERAEFGMSHDQLAARVLAAWQFPNHIITLIGEHHAPMRPQADALERSLHVARTLATVILDGATEPDPATCSRLDWLTGGALDQADVPDLLLRIRERGEALLDGLQPLR